MNLNELATEPTRYALGTRGSCDDVGVIEVKSSMMERIPHLKR